MLKTCECDTNVLRDWEIINIFAYDIVILIHIKLTSIKSMRFYDREGEKDILRKNWERSEEKSLFTVMIGRRRIGKTELLLQTNNH